ncbi:hypothetical protein WN943_006819 [Citrus x changshan-huyou]
MSFFVIPIRLSPLSLRVGKTPGPVQIALDDHDDDDDDVALILYSSEDTPHAGCSTGVIITAAICFSRPPLSDDRVESCFWNIRVEDLCLDFTLAGHRHYALTFGPDQKMLMYGIYKASSFELKACGMAFIAQVRKLSELFRPVAAHSTALPILTASMPKEIFARDPYSNASSRRYNGISPERVITERGRTWLLIHTDASLDRYQRGHERGQQHLLRCPDSIYGDTITLSRGPIPADPLYYGASSVDPYLPPPRREDMASGSYSAAGLRAT